jgi:hypothetical protein
MAQGAHVEWLRVTNGLSIPDKTVRSEFVAAGSSTTQAAPEGTTAVRVHAVDGDVWAATGVSPDASDAENRFRLDDTQWKDHSASEGDHVSVEAV